MSAIYCFDIQELNNILEKDLNNLLKSQMKIVTMDVIEAWYYLNLKDMDCLLFKRNWLMEYVGKNRLNCGTINMLLRNPQLARSLLYRAVRIPQLHYEQEVRSIKITDYDLVIRY